MAKCKECGRRGIFLTLREGLCDECFVKSLRPVRQENPLQFKNATAPKNDIDLAEQLMNSLMLGGSVSKLYEKEVKEISERCGRQGAIAAYAADLCGEPETAKGYCIKSKACDWAGAKYRPETIRWTLKWIDAGLSYPGMEPNHYSGCTVKQSREYDAFQRLGEAYEGEYMFDEALSSYKKALDARPAAYSLVVSISKVLTKMNKLDEAIEMVSNSPCENEIDKNIRRATLKELKEKKARGYVYKPRNKKSSE